MVAIFETVAAESDESAAISLADRRELTKLVSTVALNEETLTLFAIAPESAPSHPVVEAFKAQLLDELDEPLSFDTFFYSDNSLFNFLAGRNGQKSLTGRQVILAFGLEQLPTHRKKQELEQLNLAREKLFEQNVIVVFWLSRESFLDEFRRRAPDFWDWRGSVAKFETRYPVIYPYLEWLIATNAYLTMSGIVQVNRQVDIFLDQIYVSLQAERKRQTSVVSVKTQSARAQQVSTVREVSTIRHSIRDGRDVIDAYSEASTQMIESRDDAVEMDAGATKTVTEKVDLSDVVKGHHTCSVILGAPGAGKTTLLKYLALHFSKAFRDAQEHVPGESLESDLGRVKLPIFFKIADYAEKLKQNQDLGLLDYLQQFYRQWEDYFDGDSTSNFSVSKFLLGQMQVGNCLILLDGLDEVFDQDSRRRIVEQINEFADRFGHNNKLIVTSRIAGYQEVRLSGRFAEFTITDMTDEQVDSFLHRWCQAVEKAQKPEATDEQHALEGDRQAEQILRDIGQNEGVKRLTANPLLLTILALIHRNGEQLPERRVKLYELAVQTLTADWQLSKKLPNMQKVLLPEGEIVELLAPLAYWMHEAKPSGQVTHAEVVEQLAPRLADLRGEVADSPEILLAVEEFLRRVRETTGLFVERSPDVYGFMHLTFEEYFAAREMADKDPADMLETIQKWWDEPRWEEPTLLALGYYGGYSPRQFNRLASKLFEPLDAYQPMLETDKITLYGAESPNARLEWLPRFEATALQVFSLKELLFSGQVIAQVEVNARLRKALVNKLVVTGLALEDDGIIKQIQRLLRRIESFNRQQEVVAALEHAIENENLSRELRLKAQMTKLYVLCNDADSCLSAYISELISNIDPDIFCALKNLSTELGEEISLRLELLQRLESNAAQQSAITLVTAISYLRKKTYDKSIDLLEKLRDSSNESLAPYVLWALAICYREKEDYETSNNLYRLSLEKLTDCVAPSALLLYWKDCGVCQRLRSKYKEALNCLKNMLIIARENYQCKEESWALYYMGRIYQSWGKYKEAVSHYEQSRECDQQLGKETDIADMWYHLSECYREWGKYKEAIAAEQEELALREKLDDRPRVALAYCRLGHIYQSWSKCKESASHFEQSRERYQKLHKEKNVASQWYNLSDCYREWGKHKKAIAAAQKNLTLQEKLDDQSEVADAYWQLGRIYQSWGKYEEAISDYEKSCGLYLQLEKETYVANKYAWIADCYREWGKYKEAIAAAQKDIALREKLDDPSAVALAYCRLGYMYQVWGKYEEAVGYYKKNRERYQQLDKEADVADLWHGLAVCHREWSKYEDAITAEQEALALREKLDDQAGVALAYYQLGYIYQSWGKYEEATNHYEQSRERYQQLDKEADVADLWYNVADCYREWGKYKKAIAAEKEDLALREKLDEQPRMALAYYHLGYIYQSWGKCEEATSHYEQSRERYRQLDKEADVADLWYNVADCYREWGKYEEAIAAEQKALALREKLDDQAGVALVYYQLGYIYQSWGKYEEATSHYEQSRERYQQLGKEADVADLWCSLAGCYREWSKYKKAIAAEQEDLALREKLDDQSRIALAYYHLGYIYQAWGKYEEAASHYKQSRECYLWLGKEENIANQWCNLAGCYLEWGKYKKAIAAEQKALSLREKLDNQSGVALIYYQLGCIYKSWGRYEEAASHYEQSRERYQKIGKEADVADLWYYIAGCYWEWGKYKESITAEQKDFELREKRNVQTDIADAYYQFGHIYQAWDKYEEATVYHKKCREVYRKIGLQQKIANQAYWIANCYQERKEYASSARYCKESLRQHQALKHSESVAKRLRQLVSIQCLKSRQSTLDEASSLLQQADRNLKQAIQINTNGDYRENLAYDAIVSALLSAANMQWLSPNDISISAHISQFEQCSADGFSRFSAMGKSVDSAREALKISRAYLETPLLQNLEKSEKLAQQSLHTFQSFNRFKLQAETYKLLGEIYLAKARKADAKAASKAKVFLNQSLDLYRKLDLSLKASEVESIILSCDHNDVQPNLAKS